MVVYGNLRPLSSASSLGYFWYDFHIAPVVRAQVDGATGFYVIDPAFDASGPMPLDDWFARLDRLGEYLTRLCLRALHRSLFQRGSPRPGVLRGTGGCVDFRKR
ncbi:MAG: protein-glutamine glutaminase family protein [Deltaproteobacteria bacterium]